MALHFRIADDRGHPLSGVTLRLGELLLGRSDTEGLLAARVRGREGERHPLHVECPDPSVPARAPAELRLDRLRQLGGGDVRALDVQVVCPRRLRSVVVVVSGAELAGMPIVVDGSLAGRVSVAGAAFLRVDDLPGRRHEVVIDTSAHPELVPRDPAAAFVVDDDDSVFVVAPRLTHKAAPPRRRRRVRHRAPPAPRRPERID
jgi:hypothetical protein